MLQKARQLNSDLKKQCNNNNKLELCDCLIYGDWYKIKYNYDVIGLKITVET